MARRSSPKVASVSEMYETGCSSRLYRIFNFREGQATKRLVSNRWHSDIHGTRNGDSRRRPDVLTIVDKKYPHNHVNVSSKRRRDYSCKSISCVKNDQVAAAQGNKARNMVAAQNFINGKYLCKEGAISQPHEFFDALQKLYSNKELFLQLLHDQNSLLVKPIYNSNISQVKEQYQAGQKMLTGSAYKSRWINTQKSFATQCETPYAVKNLLFTFSHIRRKLGHAMGVRKKEQRLGTGDGMSPKFPGRSCHRMEDVDEAIGLESIGRKSASGGHSGFAEGGKISLDYKTREKMKIKDFMLCRGLGAVSVSESCGRNMTRNSVSRSLQNIQNIHVEATKNVSEILNCRTEEQNNKESPGAVVKTVKDQLHCFGAAVTKSLPDNNIYAYNEITTGSEKLTKSGYDLHPRGIKHMDVPSEQDSRNMDSRTQSFDMDITSEGNGSVMDSPHEIQDLSSSPEVASSSFSSSQSADDPNNMRNTADKHLSAESVVQQVMREEVTDPPTSVSQPAELPIQAVHDNSEEHHLADLLIRSSSDSANNLFTSTDMSESDYSRELVQALSLRWDELLMKCAPPEQLDPSTFEELKGLTNQLSDSTILFDCVIEVFMEIYQQFCRYPPPISIANPNVQAYIMKRIMVHEVQEFIDLHHRQHLSPRTLEQLVEKEMARRGSWLNVQVDTEDITMEMQEDILRALILEIVSEMDTRSVINW